jgi:hypothetical protein
MAILATVVGFVYVAYNAFVGPGATLTLSAAVTLVIVGATLVYLLSVSRAFRRGRPTI